MDSEIKNKVKGRSPIRAAADGTGAAGKRARVVSQASAKPAPAGRAKAQRPAARKTQVPPPDTNRAAAQVIAQPAAKATEQAPSQNAAYQAGIAPLEKLQGEYLARCQTLLEQFAKQSTPSLADKRFADASWQNNGVFTWNAALYLLNAEFMNRLADVAPIDERARDRLKFSVSQWVDAMSPSNFLLTNPEALQLMVQTQGRSLMSGAENMMADLQRGKISQTDESAFEVGRNVATSAGAVIYQNELIQLVQYTPSTEQVRRRPLLLVPPCINKFYILDLQPENSFVAHALAQGHQVFMVSWRNVGPEQGHLRWDDYLTLGVQEPIKVMQEISGEEKINALGFCVGGTILSTALAAMAAKGESPVASLTLMTTLLDFAEPGILGVFIDEQQVAAREQALGKGGLLKGQELATTFSFLRPNDLVWNYVASNYLKGQRPPAFDLLYWNGDSTNLPGPMFVWYLRHMYLQNELKQAGRLTCLGSPIDLAKIKIPAYVFAAKEDHIVPWQAAYQNTQLLGGPMRFALGASGHIAGAINPASKNKRSYWLGPVVAQQSAGQWLEKAQERPGSWWIDWREWLSQFAKETIAAPSQLGNRRYLPIEPAPGAYGKQKAPT